MRGLLILSSFLLLSVACTSNEKQTDAKSKNEALAERVMKCNYCAGYAGPGGPCYKKAGGAVSTEPGGYCYAGPGGPLHAGAGGQLSTSPGGICSEHPGGNCSSAPGSDGKNCPLACRLNRETSTQ